MTVVSPCTQDLMDSAHPHNVLSKLNEQRSQGLFCDVTIVVEDVKFRAHKNVLAACSGFFRNALTTPETWSSSQVLELMDLKSEVFASILNFIYCSKVTSTGAEDTGGLVAAGKRLGIPFLEKLAEQEREDECVKPTDSSTAPVSKKAKKETPRPEDIDRGPRITNAFSITEVCPGNNLFTPLVQTNRERLSPDVRQPPSSCPTTSCLNKNNETTQALSEHSYAVCKSTEGKDSSQWDNNMVCKPAIYQPKQLIYRNTGPLKKRHRLRGALCRSILPAPAEPQTDKLNTITPTLADAVSTASVAVMMTPPALFSDAETEKCIGPGLPIATDNVQLELGPPTLSPHTEDSISIYGCDHCPEIFTNKALLTIHAEVHKKRFVSHLFCKFCHRKFIHLKRLRNHEQVCPKAARGPPKLNATDISTKEVDLHSDDIPNTESIGTQLPTADLSTAYTSEPLQEDQSEPPQDQKAVRPYGSQRRYNCSVCKRVYVTISSLKRHENVHSWQRAYPCHYCNKVFALAEYRTKHEIWHTGERRYQCIFCLETFMTYYILKNHQKAFHGIDPSLAVKKKSANGGLKASVYPIKLYRLLPMKFRKRQYKTYSQTYSESVERGDEALPESNSLIPPFEENSLISHSDTVSFPLTFMATTKMVAPVMPRISFGKACDQDVDLSLNSDFEIQRAKRKEAKNRDSPITDYDNTFSLQPESPAMGYQDDPPLLSNSEHISRNVPFLNSLNTVKKLGELSASAKRVEDMTKEILQSSTENLVRDKKVGAKTETYIAKPACPGPSVDGASMPLCQITVKIGNEAIIRRRIKGSKLFPRKKRRIRMMSEEESPSQGPSTRENSESPRLRLRPEATSATEPEPVDDPNDCDTADLLWRPYYSYKAKTKKKRKKMRFKHGKALFHSYPETPVDRTAPSEARLDKSRLTEESASGGSGEMKRSLSRNSSPRTTYNCDICDSSFITETGLRAHVIGSHPCFCRTCGKQGPPGEAPAGGDYVCNCCMENGSCFDNTPRSPNPEKKYRCSFCPQRFLYLATKRSHEKKHQETNEEGYHSDNFTPCSKYSAHLKDDSKPDIVKTEDSDKQGRTDIKSEELEEEHYPIDKIQPKIEGTTNFMSLTAYQDMSYSNVKSPLSPCTDPLFSPTPPKVKHKMAKKWVNAQHSQPLVSKKQSVDRGNDSNKDILMGTRTTSLNDLGKSCTLLRKNESESKGSNISVHKPDKWMCKEEPLFKDL